MKKLAILFGFLAALLPQSLMACSVCFTGKEGFLEAFYATTLLLLLLPPTLLGAVGFFFYRSFKKAKEAQEENQGSDE